MKSSDKKNSRSWWQWMTGSWPEADRNEEIFVVEGCGTLWCCLKLTGGICARTMGHAWEFVKTIVTDPLGVGDKTDNQADGVMSSRTLSSILGIGIGVLGWTLLCALVYKRVPTVAPRFSVHLGVQYHAFSTLANHAAEPVKITGRTTILDVPARQDVEYTACDCNGNPHPLRSNRPPIGIDVTNRRSAESKTHERRRE